MARFGELIPKSGMSCISASEFFVFSEAGQGRQVCAPWKEIRKLYGFMRKFHWTLDSHVRKTLKKTIS